MTDQPSRDEGRSTSPERSPAERRMEAALGPDMASDAVEAAGAVAEGPRRDIRKWLLAGIGAIVALQLMALFVFPPFDTTLDEDASFQYPGDAIFANFELPVPHVPFDLDPSTPIDRTSPITFDLTISSSLFTGWVVMVIIVILFFILSRGVRMVPGRRQNALEYVYEGMANFATSLGGPEARRYVPIFVGLFVFILLSNWSGLLPFVGRTEQLRAATSDVNVTIGLAVVAFAMFHIEGVRCLGFRGYLGKFFSLRGFKDGLANGLISVFVGALEFLLEFVKPVTLSMRLWGNIYAGEIALGVISALTIFVIPVAMLSLEVLLNFMQALIFAVLTLMFTLAAIERHHEEHEGQEEHAERRPEMPQGNIQPDLPGGTAAA